MKINKENRQNDFLIENTKEIIKKNFNNENSLFPLIMKCLFHDGIMNSLDESGILEYMTFHGGTCLQRIYGSSRLSEDLDFCMNKNVSELNEFKNFCHNFEDVLKTNFAKFYNIDESDIFLRNPKNNMSIAREGDVFTWKIGVIVTLGEQRQVIKIDIENTKSLTSEYKKFERISGDFISTKDIYLKAEKTDEILVNKFISIYQRNRIQYRDFYDIGFLSKFNKQINKKIFFEKIDKKFTNSIFLKKLNERKLLFDNINEFKNKYKEEISRFIPIFQQKNCFSDKAIQHIKQQIYEYTYLLKNSINLDEYNI